jgi:thioredoxin reductase (NADPH)
MYDVIIVGAGSAGLSAGIYAARAGMNAIMLETVYPGGQIARANHVENYPGFPEGIPGADLALKFKDQAERLGAVIESAEVTGFELAGIEKIIKTADKEYRAKAVVLAMGARYKTLGLSSEARLVGSGVSYCATCDGAFFKKKDVAVIGGGDTAIEDALFLTAFANHIYIVHRRSELRAQKALQSAALSNEKIELVWDSEVESILGESFVEGIRVKNVKTQQKREINVSGVFIAVGTEPQTEGVKGQLNTDATGYIVTDADMRTSLPGVFAAGDIVSKSLRQVVTAAADGAVAINSVKIYLREK